jgi:hypothetical protein
MSIGALGTASARTPRQLPHAPSSPSPPSPPSSRASPQRARAPPARARRARRARPWGTPPWRPPWRGCGWGACLRGGGVRRRLGVGQRWARAPPCTGGGRCRGHAAGQLSTHDFFTGAAFFAIWLRGGGAGRGGVGGEAVERGLGGCGVEGAFWGAAQRCGGLSPRQREWGHVHAGVCVVQCPARVPGSGTHIAGVFFFANGVWGKKRGTGRRRRRLGRRREAGWPPRSPRPRGCAPSPMADAGRSPCHV